MATAAQLSSISSTIETLRQRLAALAGSLNRSERQDLAVTLYEAERALLTAKRHVDRAEHLCDKE